MEDEKIEGLLSDGEMGDTYIVIPAHSPSPLRFGNITGVMLDHGDLAFMRGKMPVRIFARGTWLSVAQEGT